MQDDNQTLSVSSTGNDHKYFTNAFCHHIHIFCPIVGFFLHHQKYIIEDDVTAAFFVSPTQSITTSPEYMYTTHKLTQLQFLRAFTIHWITTICSHHTSNKIYCCIPATGSTHGAGRWLSDSHLQHVFPELGRLMEYKTKPCTSCAN